MDIIEGILTLDADTIDSVLSISEKCSNDSSISSSYSSYFEELHEALLMALEDSEEYLNTKDNFSELRSIILSDDINSKSSDKAKSYILMNAFFGIFRGHPNIFFFDLDDNDNFKSEVLDHLDDPSGSGHYYDYNVTPVIGVASRSISEGNKYIMGDPLLFCEEGIAFELKNSRINVVPYSEVNKVSLIEKKGLLLKGYKLYFSHGTREPETSIMSGEMSANIDIIKFNDSDKKSLSRVAYYFIKCFNSHCEYAKT